MFITLTDHCKEQAFNRFRFGEDTLLKMAQKAVMNGFSINDAPNDKIKRYLKRKAKNGAKVWCYGSYIFIFKGEFVLVTCFPIPSYYLLSL